MKTKISAAVIALFFLMACGSSDKSKQEDQKAVADSAKTTKFILKASNMMYLSISPADSAVVANQPDPTKAEVFEKVDLGNGKCAIRASNGKNLIDIRNKNNQIFANSDNAWEWETFEILAIDNVKVYIKASTGKFVGADYGLGDILIANRDNPSTWETFEMEEK